MISDSAAQPCVFAPAPITGARSRIGRLCAAIGRDAARIAIVLVGASLLPAQGVTLRATADALPMPRVPTSYVAQPQKVYPAEALAFEPLVASGLGRRHVRPGRHKAVLHDPVLQQEPATGLADGLPEAPRAALALPAALTVATPGDRRPAVQADAVPTAPAASTLPQPQSANANIAALRKAATTSAGLRAPVVTHTDISEVINRPATAWDYADLPPESEGAATAGVGGN